MNVGAEIWKKKMNPVNKINVLLDICYHDIEHEIK